MTYTLVIKTNNGSIDFTAYGDVPDGEFIINGHGGQDRVQIEVEQHDSQGRYVIRAGHHHTAAEIEQRRKDTQRRISMLGEKPVHYQPVPAADS